MFWILRNKKDKYSKKYLFCGPKSSYAFSGKEVLSYDGEIQISLILSICGMNLQRTSLHSITYNFLF